MERVGAAVEVPVEATYNLTELSALSGVRARKIRFYVDEGLVPKPIGKGRKTRYGEVHLATLQVIVALREEQLPLGVIREYLDGYDPANVRASDPARPHAEQASEAEAPDPEAPPCDDGEGSSGPFRGLKGKQLAVAVLAFVAEKRASAATAFSKAAHRGDPGDKTVRADGWVPATAVADPSAWRRFSVSPDVELLVTTSYLAHLTASRDLSYFGPLASDDELGIVLDAVAATREGGAPRPASATTGPTGGEAQGVRSDAKVKALVRSALVEAAAERRTMRYADVARIMEINPRGQSMGMRVGSLLDETCEDEVRLGRPMLSALVVGYTGRPGKGFFATAQALGRLKEGDEEAAFWARELEAVYETWKSSAQPESGSADVLDNKLMTRRRLLATAGEAAPVIEALLALEGERGICLRPRTWCLSMRVELDGNEVPMLNIFAAGVHLAPEHPCLYIDGKVLRERRGQDFLDMVRARLASESSWRRMKVDAQCSLDRAWSEGEIAQVVGFVRWLRDQIARHGDAV